MQYSVDFGQSLFSDTFNGLGLLVGGFLITYYSFAYAAGENASFFTTISNIKKDNPDAFMSLGRTGEDVHWPTLFTGVFTSKFFLLVHKPANHSAHIWCQKSGRRPKGVYSLLHCLRYSRPLFSFYLELLRSISQTRIQNLMQCFSMLRGSEMIRRYTGHSFDWFYQHHLQVFLRLWSSVLFCQRSILF